MLRRRGQVPSQVDASGECRHLYLRRRASGAAANAADATCVHCAMEFRLAWQSDRAGLVRPTTRNLIYALAGLALFTLTQFFGVSLGGFPVSSIFLVISVLFFTRTLLGGFGLYAQHGFVTGKLGPVYRRPRLNPLPPKPYVTAVGAVPFPVDIETYRRFEEGNTLLVEHLRWSRLLVAIYRGERKG